MVEPRRELRWKVVGSPNPTLSQHLLSTVCSCLQAPMKVSSRYKTPGPLSRKLGSRLEGTGFRGLCFFGRRLRETSSCLRLALAISSQNSLS